MRAKWKKKRMRRLKRKRRKMRQRSNYLVMLELIFGDANHGSFEAQAGLQLCKCARLLKFESLSDPWKNNARIIIKFLVPKLPKLVLCYH
ncbi:hypothetical protein SADUNF_Sadunf16G0102300 [Salix dunnii]|uniref:60S ribosomal protein L41 n=1 Tax=Salix dunnii TaxID=1413687 RepID=A0A835MPV7_9ROSI|nr:hypothetical protein SADUNF_Sadunf16G0102300 [Salix dunnii]